MLRLLLQLSKGASWPKIKFNTTATLESTDDFSMYQKYQLWYIDIVDRVELIYFDKNSSETIVDSTGNIVRDQTLEICSVWYQDIKLNLETLSKMSKFFPNYRDDFVDYCKKNNIVVDPGPLHQTKFWHAGVWAVEFSKDFWMQYQKFKFDEHHNDFVGVSSNTIRDNVQRLKDLL